MNFIRRYIGSLFLTTRFYVAFGVCILTYIIAFFYPPLLSITHIFFGFICLLILVDYVFLFLKNQPFLAERFISQRLSNGENNLVQIKVQSKLSFPVSLIIIDELPLQLQERDFSLQKKINPNDTQTFKYFINPTERGNYHFGNIVLFFKTTLGFVERRVNISTNDIVSVYPSFSELGKYTLIAQTTINDYGSKRMRKIGQSMEFEQIKEYVNGDDIRTINWKATARKGSLMINNYADEKSQQVYCVIDKGRLMKMPFNGLSLLDYSINATLALSNICLQKQDKFGLITFADKFGTVVAADRKPIQREKVMQILFKENTAYNESDYEMLYMQVRNKIKQRSLIILFTNFESLNGLKRQVNYLRSISKYHLLLVVFFENTELTKLTTAHAKNVDDVYVKTIAEKLAMEKKLVIKELQQYGIVAIQSAPQNLTVNTINKYLELKGKQMI